MAKMLTTCPSCRHSLQITELSCPHCQITITGQFDSHPTLELSEEQLSFLRVFVVSRGNLKEIERILSISYPTVRSKLDQLVEAFQPTQDTSERLSVPASSTSRREVLEQIRRGELSPTDGLKRLRSQNLAVPEEDDR